MFREWLHGAAIAAGFFAGLPYWQAAADTQDRGAAPKGKTEAPQREAGAGFIPALAAA